MATYINSITPSLNALVHSMAGLEQQRKNYVNEQLKQAQINRDANLDFQKYLDNAQHSGLLSRLVHSFDDPVKTTVQSSIEAPSVQTMPLKQTKPLTFEQELLRDISKTDPRNLEYLKTTRAGLDDKTAIGMTIPQMQEYRRRQGRSEVQKDIEMNRKIKEANSIVAKNKRIQAYNQKAEAHNQSLPQFKTDDYVGNEDEMSADKLKRARTIIDYKMKRGNLKGALKTYSQFINDTEAIAGRYKPRRQKYKPEDFGIYLRKGKGGGKGSQKKPIKFIMNNGKVHTMMMSDQDLSSEAGIIKAMRAYPRAMKDLELSKGLYEIGSTLGTGDSMRGRQKDIVENERMRNATIGKIIEKADSWIPWFRDSEEETIAEGMKRGLTDQELRQLRYAYRQKFGKKFVVAKTSPSSPSQNLNVNISKYIRNK